MSQTSYTKPQSSSHQGNQPSAKKQDRHRQRARRACLSCRARKVRCNVVEEDPCSNCRLDMIQCVVPRIRRNRKIFASLLPALTVSAEVADAENCQQLRFTNKDHHTLDHRTRPRLDPIRSTKYPSIKPNVSIAPRTTSLDESNRLSHLPPFIKEPQDTISPEHIKFLSAQGALDLPSLPLQSALIEAFVEFAYPYMPIFHLDELLGIVNGVPKRGCEKDISLLLYQVILFAGSAFVDTTILEKEGSGFSNRRHARRELSRRVMLLYDLDYESDNITLVQTALLMSTWSDVPPDHKDSWYWLGLATSLAFAVGLNYDPASQGLSTREQKLRKRIWWTCYMRDRFLSLGLHRPTRIKDQEFSVPPLEATDFDAITLPRDTYSIGPNCPTLQSIKDQLSIAEICVYRARLGLLIEATLRLQAAYDQPGHATSGFESQSRLAHHFNKVEESLLSWKGSLPESCLLQSLDGRGGSRSIDIHRSHLHMLFHTMMYSLHRPRFLPTSPRQMNPTSRLSSDTSGAKVLTSALHISWIVRELRHQELDMYLPVSGVTIIFPAMVVSLLEMKCQDQSLQKGAIRRFLTCMKVMETLQQTYTVADVTMSYLKAALNRASIDLSLWESVCNSVDESQMPVEDTQSTVSVGDLGMITPPSLDISEFLGETGGMNVLEESRPPLLLQGDEQGSPVEELVEVWDFDTTADPDWFSFPIDTESESLLSVLKELETCV